MAGVLKRRHALPLGYAHYPGLWPSPFGRGHHGAVGHVATRQARQATIRGPLAVLAVVLALPILFAVRYLFLVFGAAVFWRASLRDGAQLAAANALFAVLLLGGVYALSRYGVLAPWVAVVVAALALFSVGLPLAR